MKFKNLKTGMRVVYGNHPEQLIGIVIKDLNKICFKRQGWNYLDSELITNDVSCGCGCWKITEVYDASEFDILSYDLGNANCIYKCTEKSPEQVQLGKVMDQIAELTYQANELKNLINKENEV